jgi:hypothetical protein
VNRSMRSRQAAQVSIAAFAEKLRQSPIRFKRYLVEYTK